MLSPESDLSTFKIHVPANGINKNFLLRNYQSIYFLKIGDFLSLKSIFPDGRINIQV